MQIPCDESHSYYAEQGKKYLRQKFHAESHTVVLREIDIEPIGYMYVLV